MTIWDKTLYAIICLRDGTQEEKNHDHIILLDRRNIFLLQRHKRRWIHYRINSRYYMADMGFYSYLA